MRRRSRSHAHWPTRASRLARARRSGIDAERLVDLDLLQAPGGRIEDLQLEPPRMAHQLAARWNSAEHGEHEAAEGVDVLFLLGLQELDPQVLLQFLDGRAGRGDEPDPRLRGGVRGLRRL